MHWLLYAVMRRSPRRWWFYAWLGAIPIMIFFVFVTPLGLVMRLAGKDFLHRQIDPKAKSYWIRREPPGPPPDSMKNQF